MLLAGILSGSFLTKSNQQDSQKTKFNVEINDVNKLKAITTILNRNFAENLIEKKRITKDQATQLFIIDNVSLTSLSGSVDINIRSNMKTQINVDHNICEADIVESIETISRDFLVDAITSADLIIKTEAANNQKLKTNEGLFGNVLSKHVSKYSDLEVTNSIKNEINRTIENVNNNESYRSMKNFLTSSLTTSWEQIFKVTDLTVNANKNISFRIEHDALIKSIIRTLESAKFGQHVTKMLNETTHLKLSDTTTKLVDSVIKQDQNTDIVRETIGSILNSVFFPFICVVGGLFILIVMIKLKILQRLFSVFK